MYPWFLLHLLWFLLLFRFSIFFFPLFNFIMRITTRAQLFSSFIFHMLNVGMPLSPHYACWWAIRALRPSYTCCWSTRPFDTMKVRNCWCYYRILQNFVDYFSHQLLPQISRRNSPQISRIRTAGIIIRCAFYITNDNLKSEQTIAFPNHIVNFEPVHSTNITFYHSQVTKTAVFVCVCVSLSVFCLLLN